MGKKLFENYLKSQMEQKVTSSSIRVIIFSLQILIHLEKSGEGKKNPAFKAKLLKFQKSGWFMICVMPHFNWTCLSMSHMRSHQILPFKLLLH